MPQLPTAKNSIESTYADMRSTAAKTFAAADPLTLELTFNLIHTANMAQNSLSDLAQACGLTFSGFNVLGILSHRRTEGIPLNEIGRLLLVSRANVTGLIDSLEQKGLVERIDHATDRRIYLARITKRGETLLNTHRPLYFKSVTDMASGLQSKEKKNAIELLKKWRTSIESFRKEE